MRVSKVKVKVNNAETMVLMHRDSQKGALVYDNIDKKDRTQEIIPAKKRDNFDLSIYNKTLIRYEVVKKQKLDKDKFKVIDDIFKKRKLPDNINIEDILPFLNHKFQHPVKYKKAGQWCICNLPECIQRAVAAKSVKELQPYAEWKEWYIQDKSEKLKKSITNNKIQISDENIGKRQKALLSWEPEFIQKGKLELELLHKEFNTDALIAVLCKVDMGELRENKTPRNVNAYHRNLKKALQQYQATIFGTRENPNNENRNEIQLAIYNLEIVKYLEHYFPIKKSKRINSSDDIAYYLRSETLKKTVTHQLENAVRANLIRKGKYQHHNLDASTNSDSLSNLKRDEAFVMNLITTSAFASNNIRNIIDPEQEKDILVKDYLTDSLNKSRYSLHAFKLFFPSDIKDIDQKSLWALRGAVQQIRNNVAHYKKDAINTIFNVSTFEYSGSEDIPYSKTIYQQFFEKDLSDLPKAFASQLKSGGVLSNYSFDSLKALLEQVEFQLCRTTIPFAPGFKKVMKEGLGKQNATQDELFYDMQLHIYLPKDNFSEEAWSGRYFLLKLIYNYLFLPSFMENKTLFKDTVAKILQINSRQAQKQQNKNAFAFAAIRAMNENEEISDYMVYVQSEWMQEQNKKKEEDKEDTRINFEKFVLQLFVKAFDDFLNTKQFAFVQMPQPQINLSENSQQQADKLNAIETAINPLCQISRKYINVSEDKQVSFYVYCKLLDANYLSMLRNELIKYRSASKSTEKHHLLEIIELCLLKADAIPNKYTDIYPSGEACLNRLKPFIAEGVDYTHWNGLYVQSDETTPIVHAGIELAVKYGTSNILEQLIATQASFKISDDNFTKWNNLKKDIPEKMKKHINYHEQWVEAKEKDDMERRTKVKPKSNWANAFAEKNGVDYVNNCIEINNYNWLNNKLHFDHLKQLHLLLIEILGRMAGFITIWERDFQYLDQQRVKQQGGTLLNFNNGIPKGKKYELVEPYFETIFLSSEYRQLRNHIAHFNYLTESKDSYSLIDLINKLRELLHYDRKLKNAVAKSFIDLFERHGMELKLTFDTTKHQLTVVDIVPKKIYHFGTTKKSYDKALTTNQVQTAYCKLCKALLEMKKKSV